LSANGEGSGSCQLGQCSALGLEMNKNRWLTVTVGVEMIQEHAVATTFEARAFRATSSGQG
jgi:aerobic-type carbon monoxide dehydrogenase small subunit (CoxS/CutS family)